MKLTIRLDDDLRAEFDDICIQYYRTTISYKLRELIIEFVRKHKSMVAPELNLQPTTTTNKESVMVKNEQTTRPIIPTEGGFGEDVSGGTSKLSPIICKGKKGSKIRKS